MKCQTRECTNATCLYWHILLFTSESFQNCFDAILLAEHGAEETAGVDVHQIADSEERGSPEVVIDGLFDGLNEETGVLVLQEDGSGLIDFGDEIAEGEKLGEARVQVGGFGCAHCVNPGN